MKNLLREECKWLSEVQQCFRNWPDFFHIVFVHPLIWHNQLLNFHWYQYILLEFFRLLFAQRKPWIFFTLLFCLLSSRWVDQRRRWVSIRSIFCLPNRQGVVAQITGCIADLRVRSYRTLVYKRPRRWCGDNSTHRSFAKVNYCSVRKSYYNFSTFVLRFWATEKLNFYIVKC